MRYKFLTLLLLALPASASAETIQAGPNDNVENIINGLQPGDELILADGDYQVNERFFVDIDGTEAMPIIIRAADGANPHFIQNTGENIWDLDVSYVQIRGLTFSGGSAGLRFQTGNNVTIDSCEIFGTADVALRMNDGGQLYDNMTITNNHIRDTSGTGEGMYLGCNNNGCQLANSFISFNYVHNTDGPNISQGDGIEIKEGSYNNVISDNVIHDTNYPCILTYSTVGNGAPNIIERNAMWNCGDNGIQTSADAVVRNNIVLGAGGAGIALQPHQSGNPSNLVVVHNTVINDGDAGAIRNATGSVVFANNALYSQNSNAIRVVGDDSNLTIVGNVGMGAAPQGLAAGDINNDFVAATFGVTPANVFPAVGSALIGAGDANQVALVDFNGLPREGADVGAYQYFFNNPGWTLAEGFKPENPQLPDLSDDVPGPDMGGTNDMGSGSNNANNINNANNNAGNNQNADPGMNPTDGDTESGTDDGCSQTGGSTSPGWLLVLVGLIGVIRRTRDQPFT